MRFFIKFYSMHLIVLTILYYLSNNSLLYCQQDSVYFSIPTNLTGKKGDTLTVPLYIDKRNGTVGSFDVTINFKNSLLTYLSYTNGPIVPPTWMVDVNGNNSSGRVTIGTFAQPPFFSLGSFGVAIFLKFKINQTAVNNDTSRLTLYGLAATDSLANIRFVKGFNGLFTVIDPPVIFSIPTTLSGSIKDTILIPLNINPNNGTVGSFDATFVFKKTLLTYIDYSKGPTMPEPWMIDVNGNNSIGKVTIGAFAQSPYYSLIGSGTAVYLKFLVNQNALNGDTTNLVLSGLAATDTIANIRNTQGNNGLFTVKIIPASPQLITPQNNSNCQPNTILFKWNKISEALMYRLQVATDSVFSGLNIIFNDSTLVDTLKQISGLLPGTKYFWRVNAKNLNGTSPWSVVWNFTTLIPLNSPLLVNPINNSSCLQSPIILSWNSVSGANSYHLQVSRDSIFSSFEYNDSLLTSTSKQLLLTGQGIKYFWRVRAKNVCTSSAWSAVWGFSTLQSVNSPSLVTPLSGSENELLSITFNWNSVISATFYTLQISKDSLFTLGNIVHNDSLITSTSKLVGPFINNTKYFWRVNARNSCMVSNWSLVWSFKTIPVIPIAPLLISPANNTKCQSTTLTFIWGQSVGSSSYHLQVSQDSLFTLGNIIFNDSTLTVPSKQLSGLIQSVKYFWRVNAKNIAGISPWSTVWNFTTVIPEPSLITGSFSPIFPNSVTLYGTVNPNGFLTYYYFEYGLTVNYEWKTDTSSAGSGAVNINVSKTIGSISVNTSYFYRMAAFNDCNTKVGDNNNFLVVSVDEDGNHIPQKYSLSQNFPNPFNPSTKIRFGLPIDSKVYLAVFNLLGEKIAELINEELIAGYHEVEFNSKNLPSGIYFYRINAGEFREIKKMILIK